MTRKHTTIATTGTATSTNAHCALPSGTKQNSSFNNNAYYQTKNWQPWLFCSSNIFSSLRYKGIMTVSLFFSWWLHRYGQHWLHTLQQYIQSLCVVLGDWSRKKYINIFPGVITETALALVIADNCNIELAVFLCSASYAFYGQAHRFF